MRRRAPRRAHRAHALELTLAPADDAAVRARWQRVEDAGLPSSARHRGATHRPHVTVLTGPRPPQVLLSGAREWAGLLPLELPVAGLVLLGRGRRAAVAELLTPPAELLRRREELLAAWPDSETRPWVPHLTLLPRATRDEAAAALAVLGEAPHTRTVAELRWWDPDAECVTPLAP